MLLTKKSATTSTPQSRLARSLSGTLARTVDRRAFLKRSGVAVGAGAFASQLPFNMVGRAEAQEKKSADAKVEVKRTVCTHCSVGCAVDAIVHRAAHQRGHREDPQASDRGSERRDGERRPGPPSAEIAPRTTAAPEPKLTEASATRGSRLSRISIRRAQEAQLIPTMARWVM